MDSALCFKLCIYIYIYITQMSFLFTGHWKNTPPNLKRRVFCKRDMLLPGCRGHQPLDWPHFNDNLARKHGQSHEVDSKSDPTFIHPKIFESSQKIFQALLSLKKTNTTHELLQSPWIPLKTRPLDVPSDLLIAWNRAGFWPAARAILKAAMAVDSFLVSLWPINQRVAERNPPYQNLAGISGKGLMKTIGVGGSLGEGLVDLAILSGLSHPWETFVIHIWWLGRC